MPVRAPAPYLNAALLSLAAQTLTNWRLTLVLDGPAPGFAEHAEHIVGEERLEVLQLTESRGLSVALNRGLAEMRTEYVARLDADDLSAPNRLERELVHLESRKDVVLVGSHAEIIDDTSEHVGVVRVPAGGDVRKSLLRKNRFVASSVMFRRLAAIEAGGYNAHCRHAEDYDLWLRMAILGPVENLDETLTSYRVSNNQVSINPMDALGRGVIRLSRQGLSRHLGRSLWRTDLEHLAWDLWQRPIARNRRGKMARLRRGQTTTRPEHRETS
ncbi:glycosyltransferase [Ornithinimicrobium faecis]